MKESKISWTNATVNFWTGCIKVSDGCKYCYMYRFFERLGKKGYNINRTKDATFYAPLKWKESKMIFTCSLSDFFIEEADIWRADAWKVIKDTPHHTWQILTKRPERIKQCLPTDWGSGYDNVWIGITAEDQTSLDKRIDYLADIEAKVKFLSMEPLLGPVNLSEHLQYDFYQKRCIDWIIVGGESGNETGKYLYRPTALSWIEDIVITAKNWKKPVFVKQLGTHLRHQLPYLSFVKGDRHGTDINNFPELIQVQEFPII